MIRSRLISSSRTHRITLGGRGGGGVRTVGKRRTTSSTTSSSAAASSPPPPSSSSSSFISFCIGSIAGTCGSLAGMGGGFIMIPLMTSKRILGLTQHQAHGTSLFAVTTTGIAGALSYGTNNNNNSVKDNNSNNNSNNSDDNYAKPDSSVDVAAAAAIALCGMMTARIGALATSKISEIALRKSLGVFMLCIAPLVPAKEYLVGSSTPSASKTTTAKRTSDIDGTSKSTSIMEHDVITTSRKLIVPGMIGCCSGFLAGVFGVGGGAVVVPALSLTTDMNHYQALGTSLCAMVPTAIVGTLTHYQKGNVVMRVAPGLAIGAFTGAYLGGKIGLTIPETQLKYGFSTVMVVLGLQALLK